MKTILFIFSLFSIACVTSGLTPRAVASLDCFDCGKGLVQDGWVAEVQRYIKSVASEKCTKKNYKDIVFQDNAVPPKCDLRFADLRFTDLRGADLRGADLQGAILRGATLLFASLRGAKLLHIDLQGADLRHTNLNGADLRGADLRNANLNGADLRGADLRGAKLHSFYTTFYDADLRGAKITPEQANLIKARYRIGAVIMEDGS